MEAMGGGASFTDGEWESICQLFSIDQDSDHHDGEGLVSLLIGDSNPSISLDEQLGFQTLISSNSFSQLSCCSSDLSNSPSNMHFMQTYSSNDDQISSISTPLDRLFADDHLLVNSSQIEDEIETQPGTPPPKKRARPAKNNTAEKGKRKMQAKKMKSEDLPEKSSVEMSDDDSNGSQGLMKEETLNLKGKTRANRGAATDPQSLYARKRRERINERLKVLQNLVPNGTKVDISTMLEEAVNYVKFLQLQIKLLSSDEMWMYAPLAYNGFDVGVYNEPRRGYY